MKKLELVGKRFGMLTVISEHRKNGKILWECKCDCGNTTVVASNNLKSGHTKSCGCYRELTKRRTKVLNERLYSIWKNMKSRCSNANSSSYYGYGSRGITYCNEWEDFLNFYKWAIENGYEEKLTLERIDVNGNYTPENCTWKTIFDQQRNKRNNVYITYNGKTQILRDWSNELGIRYSTLQYRINVAHWEISKAFELE